MPWCSLLQVCTVELCSNPSWALSPTRALDHSPWGGRIRRVKDRNLWVEVKTCYGYWRFGECLLHKCSWKSWSKQFLFRTSCPCRCFSLGKSRDTINLHFVCVWNESICWCWALISSTLSSGGAEADPDDREEREALWYGAAVPEDVVPSHQECPLLHAEGRAPHVTAWPGDQWDLHCWPLSQGINRVGQMGGIYGEFSGKSPEKMSPFCRENSDLEPKCHLVFLGPSSENFILVKQQFAFIS